jgi:hypothetical protein
MNLEFLFWFFLIGIIIATVQDLKRREIDFWLCKILLFGGISFIIFYSILNQSLIPIIYLALSLIILFALKNIFYQSRVFAGGDANLLFSLSALFVGITAIGTITNILLYVLFLMIAGAIYGLISLIYIYMKNFKKTNKKLAPKLKKIKYNAILLSSVLLALLFRIDIIFPTIGVLLAIYPLLYLFSKTLEEELMIVNKKPAELQEGDWLAERINLKNKTIEYSWDGLSKEDIKDIKKESKKVKVKNGLPFAPAFLIAHILYWLFKDSIIGIF